jgi:hypothetical protein
MYGCARRMIRADRIISLLVPISAGYGGRPRMIKALQTAVCAEIEGGSGGDALTWVKLADCADPGRGAAGWAWRPSSARRPHPRLTGMTGWWSKYRHSKYRKIGQAERQKRRQARADLLRTGIPSGAPSYPVEPGAHAEVTGITGEGIRNRSQQAVLVIAYPDGRTASLRPHRNFAVQNAIQFAARFNMACSRADGSAAPERMTL